MKAFKPHILSVLALIVLSACGPHFTANKQSDITTDALTEAQNPFGRSYTSFSPPSTVQNIKDQISFSESNKNFASNVESIKVTTDAKDLKIVIQWKSLSKPLVFQGTMQPKDSGFKAELSDKSAQKKDFQIVANCESKKCENLNAFLKDETGDLIGLVVKHEDRTINLVETAAQRSLYKLLSKEKQNAITLAKKGFVVSLNSVEVYPGRSYYEVKQDDSSITGELLNIDEGAAPTKTTGIFTTLGSVELIGNNQGDSNSGGELQFKITNEAQKNQIISYLQMETSISLLQHSMPSLNTDESENPLVQQILGDESNDVVKAYVAAHLVPKLNLPKNRSQIAGVEEVSFYLACEEGNKKICGPDKQGHDRTVTAKSLNQVLKQNGLPAAWGLIAFMESRFESNAYNRSGASGYWQFVYSTAKAFNLIVDGRDLRTNLQASTTAAANYFKLLLRYWNGDVKMAIISYNMGEGAAQRACDRGSENKANCNIAKNQKLNEHRAISDLYDLNKKDFWRLYSLHSFGSVSANAKSGQDYTLKFLSESLVSFHPLKYGYGNQAVDLN